MFTIETAHLVAYLAIGLAYIVEAIGSGAFSAHKSAKNLPELLNHCVVRAVLGVGYIDLCVSTALSVH